MSSLYNQAVQYLRQVLANDAATFHDGQWTAIQALVEDRSKLLVIQRTGWGKSMVYFLATRLLRDQGAGPSLLISPLLALMRNQIQAAERIGVRALTINSTNQHAWQEIESQLVEDKVDVLLISPERLSNELFRQNVLSKIAGNVGLFVVDEAHCISDWGHDFRPDYRRIVRILQALPPNVPTLATTATANDRVVNDIVEQLGEELIVIRGSLARESLCLQTIYLPHQAQRMAWLATHLPQLVGSGIIYTRTTRDADILANWLRSNKIEAYAYYSGVNDRESLEQELLNNEIRALVATSALGMGFDKPDLSFVIHYQRPGSIVEYYQQVGRAGRNGADAYGILLSGDEDDVITDYFIRAAFPPPEHVSTILDALEDADDGLSLTEIQAKVNLGQGQIEKVLKILDVQPLAPIVRQENRWYITANPYNADQLKIEKLTAIRRAEQAELKRYMAGEICHMAFLRGALDDVDTSPCGKCAVCRAQPLFPETIAEPLKDEALRFLQQSYQPILPRKRSPNRDPIDQGLRFEEGRALCMYNDAGWGHLVKQGKYQDGRFSDELVEAVAEMFLKHWDPQPKPQWVTCVPSLRHPELVPSFAERVALRFGLEFVSAIEQIRATPEQKLQHNSHYQRENIRGAFRVTILPQFRNKHVLLIDDMVDSRWTFTVLAAHLRSKGSGRVYPLALAVTTGR